MPIEVMRKGDVRDMAGYCIGPMPVEEFLECFAPAGSNSAHENGFEGVFKSMVEVAKETPERKKRGKPNGVQQQDRQYGGPDKGRDKADNGQGQPGGNRSRTRNERPMYEAFLDCVNGTDLCPNLKFVNTSKRREATNKNSTQEKSPLQPDITVYAKSNDDIQRLWWEGMKLCIEVKPTVAQDHFFDYAPSFSNAPAATSSPNPVSSSEAVQDATTSSAAKGTRSLRFSTGELARGEGYNRIGGVKNPYELENDTKDAIQTRGQLFDYASIQWERQERTFFFQVIIFQDFARLLRYDRAGVIVSARFRYQKTPYLAQFLSRFDSMSDSQQGIDTTISKPTPAEEMQARRLLGNDYDEQRPQLKIAVHNQEDNSVQYVIVSKRLFCSQALTGRGTRCYIGVHLPTGRRVVLKDAWRYDVDGMQKEGDIYALLHEKGVSNIARMIYHGDVQDQRTVTATLEDLGRQKDWAAEARTLVEHQHYRIVLDVVGTPLIKAPSSKAVVRAILGALKAHWDAYDKANILHRDLSAGNILIDEKTGEGILIDWDMCRDRTSLDNEGARLRARTGTWQFISYNLLRGPTKKHELQDDLQSAFWILLWVCLQIFPNSLADQGALQTSLTAIFDDHSWNDHLHRLTGGTRKKDVIFSGAFFLESQDEPVIMFNNPPLDQLLRDTRMLFTTFAWSIASSGKVYGEDAKKLHTSHVIMELFEDSLKSSEWPENDRKEGLLDLDKQAMNANENEFRVRRSESKRPRDGESHTSAKSRRESYSGDAASASRAPQDG